MVVAIVGLDTRSTMDLDTTLRNLSLTEKQITSALEEILSIKQDDDVYGGYWVRIDVKYDTILTPLSIDISTGDVITPAASAAGQTKTHSEKVL